MSKQEFSDIKGHAEQGYNQQVYSPQQGYPHQPGYPPQQGYPQQQGHPQQQGFTPQQGYPQVQDPAGSNVILTQPQTSAVYVTKPYDYLEFSIFVCLCCFCPLGIPAIICSVGSRDAYNAGDVNTAQSKASTAKILNIIGLVLGIIFVTASVTLRVVVYNTF